MTLHRREFQVFAKPVGPSCNLRCNYCYYLDRKELYPGTGSFRMTGEVLENYIVQHIDASTDGPVFFSWHGGEPTLAGLDFFRQVVALQKKHLPRGRLLQNGLQTNGTLLDDNWCRFLAEENFLVGISIDGSEEIHDLYRRDRKKKGTFTQVLRGYRLLRAYRITTEILCVVNAFNVNYPLETYRFFKHLGACYITFLPLVQRLSGEPSAVTSLSVPAEAFGKFLTAIFDEWAENDIGKVTIQIFEEALRSAFDKEHTLCIFKKNCGGVPVVEHNGDFYCCDHFVDKNHFLGNIMEKPLVWYLDSPAQKAFGEAKSLTLPRYCHECPVLEICNGECPRNRFLTTPDGEPGLNYLCEGYKLFFNHCRPMVNTLKKITGNDSFFA